MGDEMKLETIGDVVEELSDALARLHPVKVALYSASCSERLFPIYEAFAAREQYDASGGMRRALDLLWEFPFGVTQDTLSKALGDLDRLTPDLNKFDSTLASFTETVCICIESGIRWCLGEASLKPYAVECSLDVIKRA